MSIARFLAVFAFAAVVPTSIGCAAPTPDEDVSDSNEFLTAASSDQFVLKIDGRNYFTDGYLAQTVRYYTPRPGSTTKITGSLRLTIEVKRSLVADLDGCAGGFSTDGLSAEQIEAKDDELVEACSKPLNLKRLDGREGWTTYNKTGTQPSELRYSVTPLLTPNQHVVFAFEVNGTVRTFIFAN